MDQAIDTSLTAWRDLLTQRPALSLYAADHPVGLLPVFRTEVRRPGGWIPTSPSRQELTLT